MHLPSAMIGEADVKNLGQDLVSLRQTTLPLAASRQETTPPTPRVQTFPSATVGVLRGPGCPPATLRAAPVTGSALYLSCQTSLPSAALRHSVTSSSPCRV